MRRRIALIQGHPDSTTPHFGHALAAAYADGATAAGHEVRTLDVAQLDFPLLRSERDWEQGVPVAAIKAAQETIKWADHLVIVFPLWLGALPALLKAFLEQVLRPGFALSQPSAAERLPRQLLKGRSARVIVTMGMPAMLYRWFFRAHSLKSLERNILRFCGIRPVRESVIGMVAAPDGAARRRWLDKMRALGAAGQ